MRKQCSKKFISVLDEQLQDVYISCFDRFLKHITEGLEWISSTEYHPQFIQLKEKDIAKCKLEPKLLIPHQRQVDRDSSC